MTFPIFAVLVLAAVAPAGERWSGLYRKTDGTIIGIGQFHEFGKAETLVDYTTGETGPLFPLLDGRTGVGPAIGDRSPPPVHVLQRKGGEAALDGQPMAAIALRRRSFAVKNGKIRLAGELVRQTTKPKGILLLVHGSGPGPRRAYDIWTNFFVSRGWAVVVFDKRGSGRSTGDWHDSDLVALAADVRAILTWTRAQRELAGLKVGLWGASQAGWIIPQSAAEGGVDFAIVQAGPATPTDGFISRALESELRAYEFPPEEIAKAQAYYELDVAVSRGVKPFSDVEEAYRVASAAGAEWLLKPPDPAGAPDRRFIAVISGFDPAPYWRKVRIPILALFGGKDHVVPVEPNRERLQTLLKEAGNASAQIVTLEEVNHLAMLAKTGVRTEYAGLNRFDPVYFQTLANFLDRMKTLAAP